MVHRRHCTEPDPLAHEKGKVVFSLILITGWKAKSIHFIAELAPTKKNNKMTVKFCDASLTSPM